MRGFRVAVGNEPWTASLRAGIRVLCAGTALLAVAPQVKAQDITTGLVGHYKLDETTGTTAIDSSPFGNNGTYSAEYNTTTDSVEGKIGRAADFFTADPGGDARVTAPFLNALKNSKKMTIASWINLAPDSAGAGIGRMGFVQTSDLFIFMRDWNNPYFRFIAPAWGTQWGDWILGAWIPENTWVHLAVTYDYDAVGAPPKFYFNGKPVQSAEVFTPAGAFTAPTSADIYISRQYNSTSQGFWGQMDDVRLYNRILSDADIAAVYESWPGQLRYNAAARMPEYHDGTQWIGIGKGIYIPNAVSFSGGDWLDSAGVQLAGVADAKTGTFSGWVRRPSVAGTSRILGGSNNDRFGVQMASDRFRIWIQDNTGTSVGSFYSYGGYAANTWYHVMASWDLANNRREIYVNGVDAHEVAWDNALVNANIDYVAGTGDWGIGALPTVGTALWNGDMADIWFDHNTFIDLSVEANRRKFINADGTPVFLGGQGQLPTGSAPDIFMSGDTASWHMNKGSGGGGFFEHGSLEEAASGPVKKIAAFDPLGGTGACPATGGSLSFTSAGDLAAGGRDFSGLWSESPFIFTANGFMSGGTPLEAYRFDGANFNLVASSTEKMNFPEGLWKDGEYVFVGSPGSDSDPAAGLQVFRFDGTAFTLIDVDNTNVEQARQMWGDGTYIYVPAGDLGVHAFTFDGTNLTKVGNSITDNGTRFANAAYVKDGYIYIASGAAGLEVHTFDGTNFTLIDADTTGGSASRIWDDGSYIYVANASGVTAFTFNGTTLTAHGTFTSAGQQGRGIWGDGKYIYLADQDNGLYALTFDGTNFTQVSNFDTGTHLSVTGDGQYIYTGVNGQHLVALTGFECRYCTNPDRTVGTIIYNDDSNVMQFCDGEDWIAMGKVPGAGGAGCSNPSRSEGAMIFNDNTKVMQYCDGANWVGMGKQPSVRVILTSGTSWTVPANWNSSNNTIEAIGGGAGGGAGYADRSESPTGGGGGAYAKIVNLALTPGNSITYAIGAGGVGGIGDGALATAGGDSYFNGASCGAASVCAKGGGVSPGFPTASPGGSAASSIGTIKYSGGNGGVQVYDQGTTGGGGAAGPYGPGGNGGSDSGAANYGNCGGGGGGGGGGSNGYQGSDFWLGGNGGNSRSGTGGGEGGMYTSVDPADPDTPGEHGGAGTAGGGGGGGGSAVNEAGGSGGAGGPGTEWGAYGSGGGGGGGSATWAGSTSGNGGPGGLYGGGGGGGGYYGGGDGAPGGKGIIVITYTP